MDSENQKRGERVEGFTTQSVRTLERPDFVYDAEQGVFFPQWNAAATKSVWLTFDDGPHPTGTDKILATLASENAKATFFMVGAQASAYPKVAKRVFDAGHRVGNHTWSHKKLITLTEAEVREEITKADKVLAPYLGQDKLFRPPEGATNAMVDRVVRELGYRSVLWTVDTEDWKKERQPTAWMDYGLGQVKTKSHCVILMHDIHSSTAENLPAFLASLKQIPTAYPFQPPTSL